MAKYMKQWGWCRAGRNLKVWLAVLCGLVSAVASEGRAQGEKDKVLEIKDFRAEQVRSPKYSSNYKARSGGETWYQLKVKYEVEEDWLDDVNFVYYVLFKVDIAKAKVRMDPKRPYVLFRGSSTYMNVQQGRRYSVMFVHPNTLERYGDIDSVAVVVSHQGRRVDYKSKSSRKPGWWEKLPPVDGQLIPRNKSPFSVLLTDEYEMLVPDSTAH